MTGRPTTPSASRLPLSAFSLIELLVVIAIIGILSVLALPAFNSISQGRGVDNAGQVVADAIGYARQAAIARNRTMEVQFYKFNTLLNPADAYRALQVFELLDNGSNRPVGRVTKLPDHMAISENPSLSVLFGSASDIPGTNIPGLGNISAGKSFQFRANGRTSLPSMTANYFVTVVQDRDLTNASPNNFATVQVDPFNGRARILRP